MDSQSVLLTIKWNGNHKREIIEEQQYLFDNNLECDCVLISAQGDRIQAHQVVLSSSSEFFRTMLKDLPPLAEPPIICVPDADTSVIEAMLRFIYMGKTSVASTDMTVLVEFCNFLGIKGFVANGFTLFGTEAKSESNKDTTEQVRACNSSNESWSSDEYLMVTQTEGINSEDDATEADYLEEYLEDDMSTDMKDDQVLIEIEDDDQKPEMCDSDLISFEIEKSMEEVEIISPADGVHSVEPTKRPRNPLRQGTRSTNSQIDKALNEVNQGKTIHRLSVEYNLPRSTLYHRFRNNENLKQNYRSERKSALDNAVRAVIQERLSLKTAADRYKVPKTAIWREVRKCEQYQPSTKEITTERQNAQREILSGKSLTSISAKYGIPLTTLHRDKKKLSVEGKLPESFRVKDRTENSEYSQRLEMALKKCRGGMSQYQAAKLYNIPKATMWRYANALNKSNKKTKEKSDENADT